MNTELQNAYKRFTHLFAEENYTTDNNPELLRLKKIMITSFQEDASSLKGQECIAPLVDLRIRMNHFLFASSNERDTVDGLLTNAFRNNADIVTEQAVTNRLEKVYQENDIDWGGHLAIAGSMVAAKPSVLSDQTWNQVVAWSAQDGEREKSNRRRTFVSLFAKRCGRSFDI